MARLRYVTIDCKAPGELAQFWAAALEWEIVYDESDGALITEPGGGPLQLYLQPVPEPKVGKNRAHVDLEASSLPAEIDRLCALGASVASRRTVAGQTASAVMADPEGNEFCIAEASDT